MSWLIRLGLPLKPQKHAKLFLKLSHLFDHFGSDIGGMHMLITGKNNNGIVRNIKWFIIARDNHGPYIPIIPVVILVKKLVAQQLDLTGAMPCMNLISLKEYLNEMSDLNIHTYSKITN